MRYDKNGYVRNLPKSKTEDGRLSQNFIKTILHYSIIHTLANSGLGKSFT